MKQKSYNDNVADILIKAIKDGVAPWQRPWVEGEALATAPINPFTNKHYQGTNSIYLRYAGYNDPRWLTYNQAQEMGAQVRKGEVGRTINFVKHYERMDVLDDNGKPILDENGKAKKELVKLSKPKVFTARVFNAEQIDGLPPLPPLDERIKQLNLNVKERVEGILQESGADIRHDISGGAFYNPVDDYIVLPVKERFANEADYYATALHELGHWTGHENRLNRDLSYPFGSAGYAREELRAEISSFINAQNYGVSHNPDRHASYVSSWLKALEDNPKEIILASTDAVQISNYIDQFDRQIKQELEQSKEIKEQINKQEAIKPNLQKIYLNVSYEEKDEAKALGAKWDGRKKSWYIYSSADLSLFTKWLPNNHQQAIPDSQTTNQAIIATEKTYLAVAYDEKNNARILGAKWDKEAKSWYAPVGADMNKLTKYLPKETITINHNHQDPISEFAIALQQAGLIVNDIKADGKLHRVPIEGKPKGRDGAYILHLDGNPSGFIQNFVTGHKENWQSGAKQQLTQEELAKQKAIIAAKAAQTEQQRKKTQQQNAEKALKEFELLPKATINHPYLAQKGLGQDIINKLDLRTDKLGNLVIPVKNKDNQLQSLQRIGENGFKQFESGCKALGGFIVLGMDDKQKIDTNPAEPIIIATGMATSASIHMAINKPVVIAFQDSNLMEVAKEFRSIYPNKNILIAGDNDEHNIAKGLKNSGLESAQKAAMAVGGQYIVPKFGANQKGREYSDFSDLHKSSGLLNVQRQIGNALNILRDNQIKNPEQNQNIANKITNNQRKDDENKQVKKRSR